MKTETLIHIDPELYRTYLTLIVRNSLRKSGRLQNKLDSSDVVQEVLLLAHQGLPKFRGRTQTEFTAWLRTILENYLTDIFRHFNRDKRNIYDEQTFQETLRDSAHHLDRIVPSADKSPSQKFFQNERLLLISEAFSALSTEQQSAVEMRHIAGYTVAEIAIEMGRTKASVSGLLRRGLASLHESLRDKGLQ